MAISPLFLSNTTLEAGRETCRPRPAISVVTQPLDGDSYLLAAFASAAFIRASTFFFVATMNPVEIREGISEIPSALSSSVKWIFG